jgi:SEC-C motif domain protein
MRSRYAAYALGLAQYIIDTTHPNNSSYSLPLEQWRKEILAFSKNTQFVGLSIVEHSGGASEGSVTFYADLRQGGKDVSFTEKSRFEKLDGKWLYESGDIIKS